MLRVTAAASTFPVELSEAKGYLRVDHSDDDADVLRALKAAIEYAEERTGLSFAVKTYEWRADGWPFLTSPLWPPTWPYQITLPKAPVVDVLSLKYLDENGTLQTVSAADYDWERTPEGATITFVDDYSFPDLHATRADRVRVEFTAGFDDPEQSGSGDDPDLRLPERAKIAVLMLTAHWYENREAATFDQSAAVVLSANDLLDQLKVYR